MISCQKDEKTVSSVKYIISPEPFMVVKFDNYDKWQESLSKQSFLSKYKTSSIANYWSLEEFKNIIDIPQKALLSLSSLGNNKTIKTISFEHRKDTNFKIDSKTSYKYDGVDILAFDLNGKEVYQTLLGEKSVLSSSKIILENIVRNYQNGINNPEVIQKLLGVLSDQSPSVVINNRLFSKTILDFFDVNVLEPQLNLSNYSGFDINLNEDKILYSGLVFNPENEEKIWTNFKNVGTVKSTAVEVIPSSFTSATSILFSDFEKFYNPTEKIELKPKIDSLYINLREIASIKLRNGKAMVLVSNNIDQTYNHLKKISKPLKSIRDNTIYKLNQSFMPAGKLSPVLDVIKVDFFTIHMDHILFSNKLETLENIIIQLSNKNVVANQANYNNHLSSLNEECHIQWLTNLGNQDEFFKNHATDPFKSAFNNLKWDNHELLMSQLVVENDFGYLNILLKKTIENQKNTEVQQLARLKSEDNIINTPTFFENWRTGQQDVVYQDDKNILYLKDTKGNLIWSKALDEAIIGEITSIDIYQNRRIQMAFATKNYIHIIDKNGNDVKPFPLKIRDEITQGLSVFDYDNNGKYRFVAVFDDKIKMYDKDAKPVRGFKFKKAKSNIVHPLKHIRMGNKDYIIALEESGVLHVLNRRGETRIELDKNLKFSDNEWFEHDNHFTSISDDGEVLKIDQKGKLTRVSKKLINPKFSANDKILVIMSENEISFNDKSTELPYGLYTNPIINKNYAGIADKQAQKIYMLNNDAKILDGFPVYADELIDFYSSESELVLLCKDGKKALLVYRVKFN
jgi:hypothetical protein